ncbi:MAG: Mov34/MPN/PAD-1 family protein, partial [bacterium]
MKIIKTKDITPGDLSTLDKELLNIFEDRSKLHQSTIPLFYAYIMEDAWEAFLNHGNNVYESLKHEAQGILLGHYYKDQFGEFIIATQYAEGNGDSTRSFVEMSEECLSEISEKCQKEDLLMLIWLHTHPGFGTFYSGTDISCLKTNFYKKYQMGIVVDILKRQSLGYRSINSNVVEFHDYTIVNSSNKFLYKPFQVKRSEEPWKDAIITKTNRFEKIIEDIEKSLKEIKDIQNETTYAFKKINGRIQKIERKVALLEQTISKKKDLKHIPKLDKR